MFSMGIGLGKDFTVPSLYSEIESKFFRVRVYFLIHPTIFLREHYWVAGQKLLTQKKGGRMEEEKNKYLLGKMWLY